MTGDHVVLRAVEEVDPRAGLPLVPLRIAYSSWVPNPDDLPAFGRSLAKHIPVKAFEHPHVVLLDLSLLVAVGQMHDAPGAKV